MPASPRLVWRTPRLRGEMFQPVYNKRLANMPGGDVQAATPSGALRALYRLWAVPQKLREAVLLGSEQAAALDDVMRTFMFAIPKVQAWITPCAWA